MNYLKENLTDLLIIILFICWVFYDILASSFNEGMLLFTGFCYVFLFPITYRKTPEKYKKDRMEALQYSFSFIVTFLTVLKIIEFVQETVLNIDGLSIIVIGGAIQSIYFLLKKMIFRAKV